MLRLPDSLQQAALSDARTIKNKQAYFVLRSAFTKFVPPNGGGSGKDLNSCYLFNCNLLVNNGLD